MTQVDTVVIGGGIIGLACALEELRKKKSVCLIDHKNIGKNNASWAAAGTMIVRDAKKFFSPLRELYVKSVEAMPEWLEFIATTAQMNIPFVKGGCYYLYDFSSEEGEKEYKILFSQIRRELASDFSEMSHPPCLQQHLHSNYKTIYFPNEYYVDNRALLIAITRTCELLQLQQRENSHIVSIDETASGVKVVLPKESIHARHCIIAAGAWCSQLLEHLGCSLNLIPVKGQMVVIPKFYDSEAMVFFHRDIYMVPRGDFLLVGSTQEKGVWQDNFDDFGFNYLQTTLHKYLPKVKFKVLEKWAGIRSIMKDRYPVMGFVNESKSILLCTAHYKVGFAVAPLTAKYMSQLIAEGKSDFDISLFDPWRKKALNNLLMQDRNKNGATTYRR